MFPGLLRVSTGLIDLLKWVFFAVTMGRGDEVVLCATKLTPSIFHSLQLRPGKKAHTPDPCRAVLTHKSHAADRGSPLKQTVTLF